VSFRIFDYLTEIGFARIDAAEARVVLFRLFNYADIRGRRMFPSVATLAAECRRPPELVEAAIDEALREKVIALESGAAASRRVFRTAVDLRQWTPSSTCAKPGGKPVEKLWKSDADTQGFRSVEDQLYQRDQLKDQLKAVLREADTARAHILAEAYSWDLLHEAIDRFRMVKAEASPAGLAPRRRRRGSA